jgi:hypothetical protein
MARLRPIRAPFVAALLALLAACLLALLPLSREARAELPAAESPWAAGERVLTIVQASAEGPGAFHLSRASEREFELTLTRPGGRTVGGLRLLRSRADKVHRFRTRSFSVEIGNVAPDPWIIEADVRAAWAIADHDDGSWATHVTSSPPLVPLGLGWATAGMVGIAAFFANLRGRRATWEVRLPHLLPAAIQVALYAYWSIYWPDVRDHVPSLVLQLIMGFAADAAFAYARFGSWRIGASPLPIVLSANLFAWFDTPGIVMTLLGAFASKTYLRRDGKHILNPSAAGLTLAGVFTTLTPNLVHFGGVFHTMNASPNMAELLIVLALVPQLRFRILPVTIGGMMALKWFGNPAVARPALLLAIVLLATDPATIPRTDLGKILFGAFVGSGIVFASFVLRQLGSPDDFSKVMSIPVANALIPVFDWIGSTVSSHVLRAAERRATLERALAKLGTWTPPRQPGGARSWSVPNLALVAAWLLLILPSFGRDKRQAFEPAIYWNWGTPLVQRDEDDVPRCESNPVYCKPFSFVDEASAWLHGGVSSGPEPPTRAASK